MRGPRSLRSRVTNAATLTLAFWIVVVTIAFNVVLANRLAAQADDVLRVRAEAVASTLVISLTGDVSVHDTRPDAAIDRGTWTFEGSRLIEGPAVTTVVGGQAQALAAHNNRHAETDEPYPVRLYAQPVMSQGHKVATVVSSVELAPYAQIRNAVLLGSAVLALLLMGGVFLVMRLAVSRALSPVQAMTQQAAAWSVGDVAGRFGDEVRPSELALLAGTLDALLVRLRSMPRPAGSWLVPEKEHETPLTG